LRYLDKSKEKASGGEKVTLLKLGQRTLIEFGRVEILKHIAQVGPYKIPTIHQKDEWRFRGGSYPSSRGRGGGKTSSGREQRRRAFSITDSKPERAEGKGER
jgi:hypothetical protein